MMAFFANLFGYLLNFIYNLIGNYGVSIIIFCIIIKVVMLPVSIKQQKTMKKSTKMQQKMKEIQFKYKNDPDKLNQETIRLYKEENMSPFSGCFSAIIQIILLLSVFYLVQSPLTYMKKIDTGSIDKYKQIVKEELSTETNYPEIDIIRNINSIKQMEREDIKEEELDRMQINMEFLGLDLSQIPSKNTSDWKVFILPVIYVIISFITMKVTMKTQKDNKKEESKIIDENGKTEEKEDMMDAMNQVNKNMSMVFPIMYLTVALIAPLGLALYWLVNSILMLAERLILDKVIKDEEK
ncbi:MAG: YidC/Oxa1 family membrane protein insertase [Clostridia bacterium]|nr:YidC/Oxa1 family membrane protein insertase [Clostridia bacterium]